MEITKISKRDGAHFGMPCGIAMPTLAGIGGAFDATGVFATRVRVVADSDLYTSGASRSHASRPPI